MTPELSDLLARVGTALYSPDALTRPDVDAVYNDVDALVAEVERLRGEVAEERAAVVAWLRGFDTDTRSASSDIRWCIRGLANCIERGEHRRKEE